MILKEYSKLILNESSKSVLKESSKLVLNEADETIKQEDGTVIIDKLPETLDTINKNLAQLGQDTFESELLLNQIRDINFRSEDLLSQANNEAKLKKVQKDYTALQKLITSIRDQINKIKSTEDSPINKCFQNLASSKEFTELSKDITTALNYIKGLLQKFTNQSWQALHKYMLKINELTKKIKLEALLELIKIVNDKDNSSIYQRLQKTIKDISDETNRYDRLRPIASNLSSEKQAEFETKRQNCLKSGQSIINNIEELENKTNIQDATQIIAVYKGLNTRAQKCLLALKDINTYLEQVQKLATDTQEYDQTHAGRNWDIEIKKAAIEGLDELQKIQKQYYNTEWGQQAELLKSIGDAFFAETKAYGYTARKNPFIAYLKTIFTNSEICKAFKTIHALNYELLHNAYVNYTIKAVDLRGEGKFKKANIIFSPYFYSIDAEDCQEYLNLHKYATILIEKEFKYKILTQKYTDKLEYYIDLFYQDGNTINLGDERIAGNTHNPFKPIERIQKELAVAFSEEAVSRVKATVDQDEEAETKKYKVTLENYSKVADKIRKQLSLDDRQKLASALIARNTRLTPKDKENLLKTYKLSDLGVSDYDNEKIINKYNYDFTEVLDWTINDNELQDFLTKMLRNN